MNLKRSGFILDFLELFLSIDFLWIYTPLVKYWLFLITKFFITILPSIAVIKIILIFLYFNNNYIYYYKWIKIRIFIIIYFSFLLFLTIFLDYLFIFIDKIFQGFYYFLKISPFSYLKRNWKISKIFLNISFFVEIFLKRYLYIDCWKI